MNIKYLSIVALVIFMIQGQKCPLTQVTNSYNMCITPNYIEGCSNYQSQESCFECQLFYELSDDGVCHLKQNQDEQCCSQKFGDKCLSCQKGLFLNSQGYCQSKKIIGCLQKNNKGECINCASNFALINGKCQIGIKNCKKYLDQTRDTCIQCISDFSLINNFCVENVILGCKIQKNNVCQKCEVPFHKVDDHCQIENCASYNEYGCFACECGFYLTNQGNCQEIDVGCLRYQRGVCTDCQPHFTLRNSRCEISGCKNMEGNQCKQCKFDYVKVGDECKLKNCLHENNGICQKCEDRYRLNLGKCVSLTLIKPLIRPLIRPLIMTKPMIQQAPMGGGIRRIIEN